MKKNERNLDKQQHFISLQNDYAFVQCMKNPKVLQGFLTSVLKLHIENIESISVKDRHLDKNSPEGKLGILDVRISEKMIGEIDIELQMVRHKYWDSRSLFYTSKLYVESLEKGQSYGDLRKVINISILGFNYCKDTDYFYSSFHIREDKKQFIYSEMLEFHIIELVKLDCEIQAEDTEIFKWAKLIAAQSEEERIMLEKDPYVEEALKELEQLSNDPEKRDEYEYREKALRDYAAVMETALEDGHKEGLQKGFQEGIQKGFQEGIQEGLKKGVEEGQKKLVIAMLKNGMAEQNISQVTDIPLRLIHEWAEE